MSGVDDLVEQIRRQIAKRDGGVFSTAAYRDEPLVKTGREMRGRTPEKIKQMRALAANERNHHGSYESWLSRRAEQDRIFVEQARLMEDYEDDKPFDGFFSIYRPTYQDMGNNVLRGYFTWRTRYRQGQTPKAPASFLYLHASELINGVGAQPGIEVYRALEALRERYRNVDWSYSFSMDSLMADYVIYHGLNRSLLEGRRWVSPLYDSVQTLAQAEQALLALRDGQGAGRGDRPSSIECPGDSQIFVALNALSRYHLDRSKLVKAHPDEAIEVTSIVFARMVDHCARRRKLGYIEGMFGPPLRHSYHMFSTAVFYEQKPHPDARVELSPSASLVCEKGRWHLCLPCSGVSTNREIGNLLHVIDEELRTRLDVPPLKRREVPAYQRKMVVESVEAYLAAKHERQRKSVSIDFSQLDRIRAAAADTREALLVDEERGEAPAQAGCSPDAAQTTAPALPAAFDHAAPTGVGEPDGAQVGHDQHGTPVAQGALEARGLTSSQAALLADLLGGTFRADDPRYAHTMVALEVDAINEVFLDIVGDTIIEFDGDAPRLVEDYRDDVQEVLG